MTSGLDPVIAQVLQARQASTNQQVATAVAAKQLDATKQTGDAINQLLETIATAQKQIAQGYLDVKV
ncbi:hypothetical protein [Crateriforma conspicua]|uniref:hypothetical protein n=1 Tax=Crateriforma conspicua TaxID=2527996 RepID=UPI00118AED61|nr:hypothetical protein [Crateriforma conspicua]QDV64901.1 hypothetical protein Mal65_40690 [Crateriforma conspicua]